MPTLEITTMVGCPMNCTFCPQDKLTAAYKDPIRALTLENFKIILAKIPLYVRIDFSGMAEPWANRWATDMLQHTLEKGHKVAVYTTLQGMRDPERVTELLVKYKEKVEAVVIHMPGANGHMRGFKHSKDYLTALGAFEYLIGQYSLNVKKMTMMTETEQPNITTPETLTRAGNLDLQQIEDAPVEAQPLYHTPLMCSFTPFYDHKVLLPNGDVVLCCMDYALEHKLGNMFELDNYFDLFMSGELNMLRNKNMQYGAERKTICRSCSRAQCLGVTPDSHQFWEKVEP